MVDKILRKKNVTLTFPVGKGPIDGVNYFIGCLVPKEHWDYVLSSGGELDDVECKSEVKLEDKEVKLEDKEVKLPRSRGRPRKY